MDKQRKMNLKDLAVRSVLAFLMVFLINLGSNLLRGEQINYVWILILSLIITVITIFITLKHQK